MVRSGPVSSPFRLPSPLTSRNPSGALLAAAAPAQSPARDCSARLLEATGLSGCAAAPFLLLARIVVLNSFGFVCVVVLSAAQCVCALLLCSFSPPVAARRPTISFPTACRQPRLLPKLPGLLGRGRRGLVCPVVVAK